MAWLFGQPDGSFYATELIGLVTARAVGNQQHYQANPAAQIYADLYGALEAAIQRPGRTVNPTICTPQELSKRVKRKEAFATRVLAQPKQRLIGSEDALGL